MQCTGVTHWRSAGRHVGTGEVQCTGVRHWRSAGSHVLKRRWGSCQSGTEEVQEVMSFAEQKTIATPYVRVLGARGGES